MIPGSWFSAIGKLLSDPLLQAAAAALWKWFESLSQDEQAAYLQRFESTGGIGRSLAAHCPDPPAEAKAADDAIVQSLA